MGARPARSAAVPALVLLTHRGRPAVEIVQELLHALHRWTGASRVSWVADDDCLLASAHVPTPPPDAERVVYLHAPVRCGGRLHGALLLLPESGYTANPEDGRLLLETADCIATLVRSEALAADTARWRAAAAAARLELDAGLGRLAAAEFAERRRLASTVGGLTQRPLEEVLSTLADAAAAADDDTRSQALDAAAQATAQLSRRFRELTRGVHPVALRESGASSALADVADSLGLHLSVVQDVRRGGWEVETGLFWAVAAALQVIADWPEVSSLVARWNVSGTRRTCDLLVECAEVISPAQIDAVDTVLADHSGRLEAFGGGWSLTVEGRSAVVTCALPEDLRATMT